MILMYLIYHVKQNPDWRAPTLCNLTPLNKTLSFVPKKSLYIFSKINYRPVSLYRQWTQHSFAFPSNKFLLYREPFMGTFYLRTV